MMTRREATSAILAGTALAAAPAGVAQSAKVVLLPPPQITGGKPLMDALEARHSTREYSSRALPAQVLSDLLWAAFGINRPSGDRTAPYSQRSHPLPIRLGKGRVTQDVDAKIQRREQLGFQAAERNVGRIPAATCGNVGTV